MADFTNFATERPNYFPGQYLLEDDFELQHKYLSDRQKYHNHSLHVSGIIEGLEVEVTPDRKGVLIKPGSAINNNGQLTVLDREDTTFNSDFFASSSIRDITKGDLFIKYEEEKQAEQQENIADSYTRWKEKSTLQFASKVPDSDKDKCVELAELTINRTTGVISLNLKIREYSGLSLPNSTKALTLRSGGNANPNFAVLTGSLKIEENLTVEGTEKSEFAGSLAVKQQLQIIDSNQDANGKTLMLGPFGRLRLGCHQDYSWIQSHGSKPLAINPIGNNVGIGTDNPGNYQLNVDGNQYISGDLTVVGKLISGNSHIYKVANNKISCTGTDGIWKDIPDMTTEIDISTSQASVLIMFKMGGVQSVASQLVRARFQISIDGRRVAYTLHEFHNQGWELRDVTLTDLRVLMKGKHSIKVQWQRDQSDFAACWYGDTRNLIIIEL